MGKNRLGIVGHFGGDHEFLDGQTVKTKILYDGLVSAGYKDIFCVDTYYNKVNRIKLIWHTLKCLFLCKSIIVLLSYDGMSVYFPLLYWAKKLLHRRIFHDAIGGKLADYVREVPHFKKYVSAFDGNWVEFERLKDELEKEGIQNSIVIPNFKNLNSESAKKYLTSEEKKKFCMFSRVIEEKGVTEAIRAVVKYNSLHEEKIFLEIWGPIGEEYEKKFQSLLKQYNGSILYKGTVDYLKSVETLTGHLALLFPTRWRGEGVPGTIVDAFVAGVPVIASDWNANSELISNFVTGWVYPNERIENLYDSLVFACENKELLCSMRLNCLEKSKEFTADKQIPRIVSLLQKDNGNV